MIYEIQNDELYHYGVLGMKWGVRRYQNSDGSLTDAGRARLGYKSVRQVKKNLKRAAKYDLREERYSRIASSKLSRSTRWNNNRKQAVDYMGRANDAKLAASKERRKANKLAKATLDKVYGIKFSEIDDKNPKSTKSIDRLVEEVKNDKMIATKKHTFLKPKNGSNYISEDFSNFKNAEVNIEAKDYEELEKYEKQISRMSGSQAAINDASNYFLKNPSTSRKDWFPDGYTSKDFKNDFAVSFIHVTKTSNDDDPNIQFVIEPTSHDNAPINRSIVYDVNEHKYYLG